MEKNNLGGSAPQNRLDAIKSAWMQLYGTSEQDWEQFQVQTKVLFTENTTAMNQGEFDSYAVEQQKMEFPLCPNARELALRYRSHAHVCLSWARQANTEGFPAAAAKHLKDALFYQAQARKWFQEDQEIRSKL